MISDFLIVGAGVVGLTTAQQLLMQGNIVTILDRGAAGMESSWAGGGILSALCPWDYPDEVTRLTSMGAALYPRWADALYATTGIDSEYEISGMQVLPPFDFSAARNWGIKNQYELEKNGDVVLLPEVAQVRNPRLIQALRKHVGMLGGRIVEHCNVQQIAIEERRVSAVITSGGTFNAGQYIISAGAWSTQLLGTHALQLDIKPVRGQMLLYKFAAPPLPHIVLQDGMYLIPRRDGHVLVGSTLENVGFDKSTTAEARVSLQRRAQLILPALREMPVVQHWSGLRPASPGNIPTIGQHPYLQNLYLNSGHFRYGVTMAPASSALLINELNGSVQPFDVSPYHASWGVVAV